MTTFRKKWVAKKYSMGVSIKFALTKRFGIKKIPDFKAMQSSTHNLTTGNVVPVSENQEERFHRCIKITKSIIKKGGMFS